jgi:hypothetical protein
MAATCHLRADELSYALTGVVGHNLPLATDCFPASYFAVIRGEMCHFGSTAILQLKSLRNFQQDVVARCVSVGS